MNCPKRNILAFLMPLLAPLPAAAWEVNPGGSPMDFAQLAYAAAKNGGKILDGDYASASVIYLSAARCISLRSNFGEHAASFTTNGLLDRQMTNLVRTSMLPRCAVALFDRYHAFDTQRITWFSARGVLRACPDIPVCPADAALAPPRNFRYYGATATTPERGRQ